MSAPVAYIVAAGSADLEADLLAIEGSFGAIANDDKAFLDRAPDDRAAHLNRVAGL